MAPVFRETFASLHRRAAERDARLYSDLERVFMNIDAARETYDAMQERAFEELARVLEGRRFTEEEITDGVNSLRQKFERGQW